MEKRKKMRYKNIMQKTMTKEQLMTWASVASVVTAGSLILLKLITYLMTGSMAILSSLFDSIQDGMTSGVNYIAVRQSNEPADSDHRFGHGKAQGLGSLIQGFIILIAALFLLREALERLVRPVPIESAFSGVLITVLAIVATVCLVWFQTYVIKKTNSLSIKADRAHYTGDIGMNVGVIVSIVLSTYCQWYFVDAVFGVLVSFYLFYVVYRICKESCHMLMDTEMPDSFRRNIRQIVLAFDEVKEIVDLKTRQSGNRIFVQFCIRLPEELTLRRAHAVTEAIEEALKRKYPDIDVLIHPEPYCHL